jgi:hypothetical protein
MLLVVDDAVNILTQEFRLNSHQRIHVRQVSLWLYAHDIQNTDTFEIRLLDSDSNLVWSHATTGSLIKSYIGANTYSHGKFNIDTENELILGPGEYTLELEQLTGYTANNFLSWARDWESTYQELHETSLNDGTEPFYLRLYDFKGREVST